MQPQSRGFAAVQRLGRKMQCSPQQEQAQVGRCDQPVRFAGAASIAFGELEAHHAPHCNNAIVR